MTNLNTHQFFIDGNWVDAAENTEKSQASSIDVINPATEKAIASIAMGSKHDVDRAVAAAKKAFTRFSQTTKHERVSLLERILSVYERRYDEMSALICAELGAPITLCDEAQNVCGTGHLKATIKTLKNFEFETTNAGGDLIIHEAIGVCGMICPWNWPINQIALKVFPALAAGCTIVLKPSEITPLNALLFTEILQEAGVPHGVFNLVNGDGLSVGSELSKHPDIQMISFTGSTRAGTLISKDAADTVKKVTLELGGKSPNIILPDVNLKDAIHANLKQCFANSGQSCNAPTRMLVHKSQYQEAMSIATELAAGFKVGDPTHTGAHLGPVVSELQYNKIQKLIDTAIQEGATLLAGGIGKPEGFETGFYVKPTVFAHVTNSMTIAQEEVFGPVLVLIVYEDIEDAIDIANDTPYGLAAYIQSADLIEAQKIMRRLRAGMVRINGSDIDWASPFGGYKLSGNGREGGHFGIEDYCEIKAVSLPQN